MPSIRRAICLVAAAFALTGPIAVAQATPEGVSLGPEGRWSDTAEIVIHPSEVDVTGRRCPAMWKLKRGTSTLFILADVLAAPDGLKWDSSCFERTLKGANALLLQAEWHSIPIDDEYLPRGVSVRDLISDATFMRLQTTARRLSVPQRDYEGYRPQWAFYPLVGAAYSKQNIHLETYPSKVPGLARSAHVPVRKVPFYQGTFETRNIRNRQDRAGAEDCLNSGLDRVDYTLDVLPPLAEAWAKADMATVLKLFPDPQFGRCVPAGDTSDRDLQAANMKNWTDALDNALNTPGKTVAVVPLDWLLYKGGALDQLKARGVDVIAPVEEE
jgi:hypothetical protein